MCYNSYTYADYSASITTSGAQSIDVSAGGAGTAIGVDNISITTNCRAGYNLSMTASVDDNNLYLNGDTANNISGKYFTAVDGTNALDSGNNTNKWGYYYNSSSSTAPTKASTFSAVPVFGATPVSLVAPTASATDISDSLSIYYGVSVNTSLTAGTYKMKPDTNNSNNTGAITYYLTMAEACIPYIVQFSPTSTAGGTTLSGAGTMPNQEFYKDITQTLTANAFTPPTDYEFKEWNTAQDGTGTAYTDAQSVTNLTTPGNTITLYAQWEAPSTPLYDEVAAMSKGMQTNDDVFETSIWADFVPPTEDDPISVTSGVYEYDPEVFGLASDIDNGYSIYYYRGMLESYDSLISGDQGLADAYPNYVVLSDASSKDDLDDTTTCWRIVRTTASGGVKMIYNGVWSVEGETCINTGTSALLARVPFALQGNSSTTYWQRNINRVGYTFNNDPDIQDVTDETSVDIVFGNNDDLSLNDTRSNIKAYLEDTWYANNMTAYTDILEPDAGYCNDRSAFSDTENMTASETIVPYGTTNADAVYFGAYARLSNIDADGSNGYHSSQTPSFGCPRGPVDLYYYEPDSDGVANELKYPVALLTWDEAFFAGWYLFPSPLGSSYGQSYLGNTATFLLLSPAGRGEVFGDSYNSFMISVIPNYITSLRGSVGVRPVISLVYGTSAVDGTGIATDPWIVNPPSL